MGLESHAVWLLSIEELFAAVAEATGEARLAEAVANLRALDALGQEAGLMRFAEKMIMLMTKDEALAVRRMIGGDSGHSKVGEVFIQLGPRRCIEAAAGALVAAMDRGELARGAPQTLTMQLAGAGSSRAGPSGLRAASTAPDPQAGLGHGRARGAHFHWRAPLRGTGVWRRRTTGMRERQCPNSTSMT